MPVFETFETPAPLTVEIDVAFGAVHLIASDRDVTEVTVRASDPTVERDVEVAEGSEVTLDAGRLVVFVPRPRGVASMVARAKHYGSVEVVIELPPACAIRVTAGFADVRGDGRFGDVRVKSGAGDIRMDECADAHLETKGGGVRLDLATGTAHLTAAGLLEVARCDGPLEIRNLAGVTWVGEAADRVTVRSSSGDVTIDRALGDVVARTASGDVRIGEVVTGTTELKTSAGRVGVGIRDGAAAWIDARSRFGRVTNDLEAAEAPDPASDVVEIHARTGYGHIDIHRA